MAIGENNKLKKAMSDAGFGEKQVNQDNPFITKLT